MGIEYTFDLDFTAITARLAAATPEALGQAAEHIRSVAAPLTPVDTGHLVGSASVEINGDQASITYPGPYARYQHNRFDLRHETGQANYLGQPMVTEKDKAMRIIAENLKRAL